MQKQDNPTQHKSDRVEAYPALAHFWRNYQEPASDTYIQPAAILIGFACGEGQDETVRRAAAEFLRAVLACATANGYKQTDIAETVILDAGADIDRRVRMAVEVCNMLKLPQYLECLKIIGYDHTKGGEQ